MDLKTFPTTGYLEAAAKRTPPYMAPNMMPYVLISEGYLAADFCEEIIEDGMSQERYEVDHCNAVTRELYPIPRSCVPVETLGFALNELYWQLDIRAETAAWLQTYEKGGSYQLHMDDSPGQNRKMTAVVLLTDPDHYGGGDLEFYVPPQTVKAPRTQGTVVLFPHWLLHRVTPLTWGNRQSLNLGFWGNPPKPLVVED